MGNDGAMTFVFKTAITCFAIMITDFIIYGEIFPLLGLYCGSYAAAYFNFSYLPELAAVAGFSLLLFFLSLAVRFEKIFWKKLYTLDNFYKYVLHVRDLANVVSIMIFVATLVSTSFNTALLASTVKAKNDGILEHPLEGFVHVLCYRLEFYTQTNFKWCNGGHHDHSSEAVYEAKVLYAVAFLCISVAKMLYFNTLFTYLQTLKMFRDMQASRAQQAQQQDTSQQGSARRRRPRPAPPAGHATAPVLSSAARLGAAHPGTVGADGQLELS
jgi:hypothetical protein